MAIGMDITTLSRTLRRGGMTNDELKLLVWLVNSVPSGAALLRKPL